MQVDAVEQGAGDLVEVVLDLAGSADAVFIGVVVVAAGTGVRCIFVKLPVDCQKAYQPCLSG